VKVDGGIGGFGGDLTRAATDARALEEAGYDGAFSAEVSHDPFFPLVLASQTTSRIDLGTGIAVAFARNPMTLANIGHDLQLLTRGRFILGLGSQIKPHITKRFSMPWSHPAPRMRELITAMRAIWACWNDGQPLRFKGEFYTHLLMTPMFDPGPSPHGAPRVFLAAVGPGMTQVAGEVADGLIAHAFTTLPYFRDVTLPALERGLAKSGRTRADVEVAMPMFIVTGRDEAELRSHAAPTRKQLAFYASTPAYLPVLEHHGWGDLGIELNRLSKQGEWDAMGDAITDEVLEQFAIIAPVDELPDAIGARWAGMIDRTQFFAPDKDDHARWAPVVDGLKAL
jgi:probable F420-dependent oxidoreductase